MSTKLIALGNVLMRDDGIAIEVARRIEDILRKKGIEVIYGETDYGYCITRINENDHILLLDAACIGKNPGEVTVLPLDCTKSYYRKANHHDYSLIDLLGIYFPSVNAEIIAIEVNEVNIYIGLSNLLKERINEISKTVLDVVNIVI